LGTHYSLHKEPKFLEKRFSVTFDRSFQKVYHVSAFDNPLMPVITDQTPDKLSFFYWGLVPFWLKEKNQIKQIRTKTLNARAETLFNKPSFKIPIRKKRCLIVVDGYFEWREIDSNIPEILKKYDYNELKDYDKQKHKGDSKQTALF